MSINTIYKYKYLTEKITTSGQPSKEELTYISNNGFDVVINLGLNNTEYSVSTEEQYFESKKIIYKHIPVLFENPKESDLAEFIGVMEQYKGSNIFIHCAANKRVSVFMALYRVLSLGWSIDIAMKEQNRVWIPNPIWMSFIKKSIS